MTLASDIFAVVKNFAGLWFEQTGNRLERRRLARSVRADQCDNAAGFHGQGNSVQRVDCTVTDRQIFYF